MMRIIGLSFMVVLSLSLVLFSNPSLLAHIFSENENALFLTMIDKIKAETQLVGQDISNNTQQAQVHAKQAVSLLAQNDPGVNTTWSNQILETNPRITADLMHSLNDLVATVSLGSSNSSSVKSKVNNIGNLLDEAVSVRASKDVLNNPKTQALVLANLGNEVYNNYGNALGLAPSTIASMGGMKMTGMTMNNPAKTNNAMDMSGMSMGTKGTSMNMSTTGGMSEMSSINGQSAMNQNNPQIKNITAYETAQSLVSMAQQALNKDLKPIAPANATASTANLQNYVDELKSAINAKSSFINVMELVHVRLHPTLISAYNLITG